MIPVARYEYGCRVAPGLIGPVGRPLRAGPASALARELHASGMVYLGPELEHQ